MMRVGRIIGITGVPSCGKTSVVRALYKKFLEEGGELIAPPRGYRGGKKRTTGVDVGDFIAVVKRDGAVVVFVSGGDDESAPKTVMRILMRLKINVDVIVAAMRVSDDADILAEYKRIFLGVEIEVLMKTSNRKNRRVPTESLIQMDVDFVAEVNDVLTARLK